LYDLDLKSYWVGLLLKGTTQAMSKAKTSIVLCVPKKKRVHLESLDQEQEFWNPHPKMLTYIVENSKRAAFTDVTNIR
jgi:hypothetical protein